MAFYTFGPVLTTAGGTITGALTIAGLLTTQLGIANSGAGITNASTLQTGGLTLSGSPFGPIDVQTVGVGLQVGEGANAKQGITAAMTAGTITQADTKVTASSRIFLTSQATGGTVGGENVSARTAGTSFTITSTNAADTSTVGYLINEPG